MLFSYNICIYTGNGVKIVKPIVQTKFFAKIVQKLPPSSPPDHWFVLTSW